MSMFVFCDREMFLTWHEKLFPGYVVVFSGFFVASFFLASAAAGEADSFAVANPDSERVSGAQLRIKSLDLQFQVSGRDLLVSSEALGKRVFHISEPGCLSFSNEIIELVTNPDGFQYAILPGCRTSDTAVIADVVNSSSVRLRTETGEKLDKDKDFAVNSVAGRIEMISGRTLTKVVADYDCWLTRLDSLVADQTGNLELLNGIPSRSAPLPPTIPTAKKAVANILSRWGNRPLDLKDIMAITGSPDPPEYVKNCNTKVLASLKRKLCEGQQAHIVFLGDSVTAGFCADSPDKSYPNLVISNLRSRFPAARIYHTVYGFSGLKARDVVQRLPDMILQKPDLLVVEFANDLTAPYGELEQTYAKIIEACKKSQTCLMLVTPHFPIPSLANSPNWKSIAANPYISLLRDLTRKNDLAIADVSWRWEHLSTEGLRPNIMLVNFLNHPNNKGHEIYAEEILRYLQP
jgi:lysophospholipase L1-like esterase